MFSLWVKWPEKAVSESSHELAQLSFLVQVERAACVTFPLCAVSLAVGSNGSSASAQNVAIRLYDEQGNVVRLGEAAAPVVLRSGSNTLNFSAKYYSPQGNATAGDASAVATYTVTYS